VTTPKIFVLRSDRLGDIILSSGYLAALANSFPGHEVELWLSPDTAVCSQILHPRLTVRKLPFDRYLRDGAGVVKEWLETVRAETYEFAVIPQFTLGYPEIIALAYLDFGPRWGFLNRELSGRPEWVYREFGPPKREEAEWITHGPSVGPFLQEVDKYRALAQKQSLCDLEVEPQLSGIVQTGDADGLLVWPGSGAEIRRWPADRFAAVARSMKPVKVTVGAVPSDPNPAAELLGYLQESGVDAEICYRAPGDLQGTVQWLAGFRQVLTNDTGIAHLAAAAGAAVTAISGSHFQGRFAVAGSKSLTVFADVPCRQCGELCLFESDLYPCVADIDADSVAALLGRKEKGIHRLPTPRRFHERDLLFQQLADARRSRARIEESRLFAVDSEVQAARTLVREAERHRDEALVTCREAEKQRDQWRELCHHAESQRDAWRASYLALGRESQDLRPKNEIRREDPQGVEDNTSCVPQSALAPESVPRISIITPSFQSGQYLEETIQSVVNQEYPNFEHIVVDGGSTDETLAILKRYPHVRWISEPDSGQAHAINKGLLMSTGEIIAYLNADDIYRPAAFLEVAGFFSQNPSARIVVGDCDYIDEKSNTIGRLNAKYERLEDLIRYWGWDRWFCIPQQSVFWRRDLLAEAGLFDISLQMVMDYEMWLRIASLTQIHVLKRTLAAFRLTPESKTCGSTHLMYYEEFKTSRKYWKRLRLKQRIGVSIEARRHLSGKLLDVAEHFSLNDLRPGTIGPLLWGAARHWPLSAIYPRFLCTAGEVIARPALLRRLVKTGHRRYLGLKWKMGQSWSAKAKESRS